MDQVNTGSLSGKVQPFRVYPAGSLEPVSGAPRKNSVHLYDNSDGPQRLTLPGDWVPAGGFEKNLVMYQWASIVGYMLSGSPDRRRYNLAAMYIEYENNGGAPVAPPTNDDRAYGRDYYDSLLTSGTRDYLRVPLTAAVLDSTDLVHYPDGNRITCFAQTEGLVGVHGKPFSDVQQSRVFGGALVSTPQFSDATQDMIFSRFYYTDVAKQLVKLLGSQVGMKWPILLDS